MHSWGVSSEWIQAERGVVVRIIASATWFALYPGWVGSKSSIPLGLLCPVQLENSCLRTGWLPAFILAWPSIQPRTWRRGGGGLTAEQGATGGRRV